MISSEVATWGRYNLPRFMMLSDYWPPKNQDLVIFFRRWSIWRVGFVGHCTKCWMCPGIKLMSFPDMQMFVAQCLGWNIEADCHPLTHHLLHLSFKKKSFWHQQHSCERAQSMQVGELPLKKDHQTSFKAQIYDDLCGEFLFWVPYFWSQWFHFR